MLTECIANRVSTMKIYTVILALPLVMNSCLPVRTIIRPKITGFIFEYDSKKPIVSCNVNGTFTNEKGFYKLKKISYIEWVPIMTCRNYNEIQMNDKLFICKEGFYNDTVTIHNTSISKQQKTSVIKMDSVFLTVQTKK